MQGVCKSFERRMYSCMHCDAPADIRRSRRGAVCAPSRCCASASAALRIESTLISRCLTAGTPYASPAAPSVLWLSRAQTSKRPLHRTASARRPARAATRVLLLSTQRLLGVRLLTVPGLYACAGPFLEIHVVEMPQASSSRHGEGFLVPGIHLWRLRRVPTSARLSPALVLKFKLNRCRVHAAPGRARHGAEQQHTCSSCKRYHQDIRVVDAADINRAN